MIRLAPATALKFDTGSRLGEIHGLGGRLHHLEEVLSAPVRVIRHDQRAVDGSHLASASCRYPSWSKPYRSRWSRVAVVVPASDVDHQHPGVIRVDVGGEAIGDEGVQRSPREVDVESLLPRRLDVPLPAIVESDEIARDGESSQGGEGVEPDIHPRRLEHDGAFARDGALMRIEPQVQPVAEPKPGLRCRDERSITAPHRVERRRRHPLDSPRHMPSNASGESTRIHRLSL